MATFIRVPQLADRLGVSVRTIFDRVKFEPNFPQPVKLGSAPQSPLGFVLVEVESYEASLMAARSKKAPEASIAA